MAHPGRQHSYQLAKALHGQQLLDLYVTGVPASSERLNFLTARLLSAVTSRYECSLPPEAVLHCYTATLIRNVAKKLVSRKRLIDIGHRGDAWFDRVVSRQLRSRRVDIVVGYENASLRLFRAAKRIGAITVLDAASCHHTAQDKYFNYVESDKVHRHIVARKDAEIELADYVLTVSEFAKNTYIGGGVSAERIFAIPVGADTELFNAAGKTDRSTDDPLRFVFVGNATGVKGWDLLVDACDALYSCGLEFTLAVIGADDEVAGEFKRDYMKYHSRQGHRDLAVTLRKQDVLVLPSRFDSFGMVVVEAMASGLPVVVSKNVGASQIVTHGMNGLVVQAANVSSLKDSIKWCIQNRAKLAEMSRNARLAAEKYSWTFYKRAVVATLQDIFQSSVRAKSR